MVVCNRHQGDTRWEQKRLIGNAESLTDKKIRNLRPRAPTR